MTGARRWPLALVPVAVGVAIALGHEGRRVAQLFALAAPVWLWLLMPLHPRRDRVRAIAVWAWSMMFVLDGLLRAYLLEAYDAAPDGALVMGAAANAHSRESIEYLSMYRASIAESLAWLLAAGGVLAFGVRYAARADSAFGVPPPTRLRSKWLVLLTVATLVAATAAYASKPWRRLHPAVFWAEWVQGVHGLRAAWADQQVSRDDALRKAAALVASSSTPSTVVLVVTESINRDNLSLYGYGRATTPQLLAQKSHLGERLLVLNNAWSVDASTVPALRNLFNFGLPAAADPPHLLAVARAAGYKVWWIGNQDDIAIEHTHARLADEVELLNRTPGRSSTSLDGEVLGRVRAALQDTAVRKLIVVHLMGAHPHYGLRFPTNPAAFGGADDAVDQQLRRDGRSSRVRRLRRDYDSAILYQDAVVSELLQLASERGESAGHRAWMYLSDHGQAVGHGSEFAGHSPGSAAGYRIPALIWQNRDRKPVPADVAVRPFRSDWAAWTLVDLLGIEWAGGMPERNVLDPRYTWQPPALAARVDSFID